MVLWYYVLLYVALLENTNDIVLNSYKKHHTNAQIANMPYSSSFFCREPSAMAASVESQPPRCFPLTNTLGTVL